MEEPVVPTGCSLVGKGIGEGMEAQIGTHELGTVTVVNDPVEEGCFTIVL